MDFNLNAFLTPELTAIIITALIVPIIKGLSKYVTAFIGLKVDELQEKLGQDKVNAYIDKAEDVISTVVDSVSQTYVDVLKREGNFDEDARNEAFTKAKDNITSILKDDGIDLIKTVYDDFDGWVENKIETFVKMNKQLNR